MTSPLLRLLGAMQLALIVLLAPAPLRADAEALWRTLRLDELVDVMSREGQNYGAELAEQLFEGGGGPSWTAFVAERYDPDRMIAEIRPEFLAALSEADTSALEKFYASDVGRRIVESELEARIAFLDDEVEAAAHEMADALAEDDPQRLALVNEFIEINDLVESNVAAALTYSYAFNLGLVEGEAFDGAMTESDALSDAWAQEEAMREESRRWLIAQLLMAFAPLSDGEIRDYIALSQTPEGQALNGAYFTAFEPTLTAIAKSLGEGVARFMKGRDI